MHVRNDGKQVVVSGRTRRLLARGMLVATMAVGLAACGGSDNATLGKSADIVIDSQGFKPNQAEISVGQEVIFSVINNDTRPHTFTLPYLFVDVDNFIDRPIAPGERIDVKIKADEVPLAGYYSFYSKDLQFEGYQGKLFVKP